MLRGDHHMASGLCLWRTSRSPGGESWPPETLITLGKLQYPHPRGHEQQWKGVHVPSQAFLTNQLNISDKLSKTQ